MEFLHKIRPGDLKIVEMKQVMRKYAMTGGASNPEDVLSWTMNFIKIVRKLYGPDPMKTEVTLFSELMQDLFYNM